VGVEAEIKAIIHALIINSVDASPDKGVVSIRFNETAQHIEIEISDSGKGIPQEIRDKLFQPP